MQTPDTLYRVYLDKYVPQLVEIFLAVTSPQAKQCSIPSLAAARCSSKHLRRGSQALGSTSLRFNALLCCVKSGVYNSCVVESDLRHTLADLVAIREGKPGQLTLADVLGKQPETKSAQKVNPVQQLGVERMSKSQVSRWAKSLITHTWADTRARLEIGRRYTRPYSPWTNGKAEALIKTLLREWGRPLRLPDKRPPRPSSTRLHQVVQPTTTLRLTHRPPTDQQHLTPPWSVQLAG